MSKISTGEFRRWFDDYVDGFLNGSLSVRENILLKKIHTERVCREIRQIGSGIGLDGTQLAVAELMALFHDIGRFSQYSEYNTFVDSRSVNHAELGAEILRNTRVLDTLDNNMRELIIRAVSYHNLAFLPEDEDEKCLMFTRLLRDADKVDIYRVVTDYYSSPLPHENQALELDLPDSPGVSEEVMQDLASRQIVNVSKLENLNDFKLLQAGWVYDINYVPTLEIVESRGYLGKIRSVLPDLPEIEDIFSSIDSYIRERLS